MRKVLFLFLGLLPLMLFAQTDGISYQAVIISDAPTEVPGVDITEAYLSEAEITVRFTILDQNSVAEYQEEHQTATDRYGMISVIIGQGVPTGNGQLAFDQIDWNGTPRDLLVELAQGGADLTVFSQQPLLFVPYAYHRNITATGTLIVDGATTLHNGLDVTNATPTRLSGTLTVDGVTALNSALNVSNGSSTDLSGTLDVDGMFTAHSESFLNGQVTIDAGTTGGEGSYSAYGLRVEGTEQGVAVRLNGGVTETRNFVSFLDGGGTVHGRIEGQTLSELHSSFRFIWDVTMAGLSQAFVAAEGIACGTQLDFAESGVMLANNITLGAQWVELTYDQEIHVGVTYLSGGADYAEWLEREDQHERFSPGDVIGVRNGRISKRMAGAQQILVISTLPIVLGNQPPEGAQDKFERVAFLGQVPVKVVGPVGEGDLLVPSGYDDGLAVAFAPEDLPTDQFDRIIGVAWQDGTNTSFNTVNTAIGLNGNAVAGRVAALEKEVAAMRSEIDRIARMLNGAPTDPAYMETDHVDDPVEAISVTAWDPGPVSGTLSDVEFEAWLVQVGDVFVAAMGSLKAQFEARNIDYRKYPDVALIVDSPLDALHAMHTGTFLPTVWNAMEKRHVRK